ncbi:hypothetical protein NLJ89_g11178 [Agrocybe chaxingu]|uniref:Pleurotolysin B C-terminal domain-containing protein n=1 Tax=Agrocybe chaxingu TaxID=84603 RepID=A0A9W8JP80_9AGAR|nr:hypothetical protein NLJ89_g11178 [Agrocybe chaxingu]
MSWKRSILESFAEDLMAGGAITRLESILSSCPCHLAVLFFNLLLGIGFVEGAPATLYVVEQPDATRDSAYSNFGTIFLEMGRRSAGREHVAPGHSADGSKALLVKPTLPYKAGRNPALSGAHPGEGFTDQPFIDLPQYQFLSTHFGGNVYSTLPGSLLRGLRPDLGLPGHCEMYSETISTAVHVTHPIATDDTNDKCLDLQSVVRVKLPGEEMRGTLLGHQFAFNHTVIVGRSPSLIDHQSLHTQLRTMGAGPSKTFIYTYEQKQVLAERPASHLSATIAVRELFPEIPAHHAISFYSSELLICHGETTEISSSAWADAIPRLERLTVKSLASGSPGDRKSFYDGSRKV